jgi:hypothetical protein
VARFCDFQLLEPQVLVAITTDFVLLGHAPRIQVCSLDFQAPRTWSSWARDYRLVVTATDDGPVITGISGHICQHTDDLLAVTITSRWVSSRHKLITAGCVVVQDGDNEGTVSFDPNDTKASLAVLRIVQLK